MHPSYSTSSFIVSPSIRLFDPSASSGSGEGEEGFRFGRPRLSAESLTVKNGEMPFDRPVLILPKGLS
jgi:hypothetical protein